jgi:hypothetical protein
MSDVIVEEVRRAREELIKRFGGINGYFQHCQSLDRASAGRQKLGKRKQPFGASRKSPKLKKDDCFRSTDTGHTS